MKYKIYDKLHGRWISSTNEEIKKEKVKWVNHEDEAGKYKFVKGGSSIEELKIVLDRRLNRICPFHVDVEIQPVKDELEEFKEWEEC